MTTEPQKMYALINYTYDHYEWEKTHSVSFDIEKLKKRYSELQNPRYIKPLIGIDDRENYYNKGLEHWTIEEIDFLQ